MISLEYSEVIVIGKACYSTERQFKKYPNFDYLFRDDSIAPLVILVLSNQDLVTSRAHLSLLDTVVDLSL